MSDDFKKKLDAYEKGELSGEELEEFEKELGKLEKYQQVLADSNGDESDSYPSVSAEKQRKLMRRGKWRARISTAFFALGLFILATFVTSVLTATYYQWGNPDRVDVFRSIIDQTLTITNPYGHLGSTSTSSGLYFNLKATRDLNKKIGGEWVKAGEMNVNFLFSLMSYPEEEMNGNLSTESGFFISPTMSADSSDEWERLERLPEGTVASAYISLSETKSTTEVFQLVDDIDIDLVWLAVETGKEWRFDDVEIDPIGFPNHPIWHIDDWIVTSREEEKGFLFGKIVTEGSHTPEYEEGDAKVLQGQFMKTLEFLKQHERKANKFYFGQLNLEDRIDYLVKNGFYHYGIVITGPTQEVLKLRDEPWVHHIKIDEVALWNWYNYE